MSDVEKVKKLREATGAGFKDCNLAIKESAGNLDKAIEILRVKGISKASKKMSRDAKEGVVVISSDETKTSVIEVNCETDFVAKNDDFIKFSSEVASQLLENPDVDLEEKRTEQVAKIGENIRISRSTTLSPNAIGLVESYVHTGGKVAVLLSLGTSTADAANLENVQLLAKDLCMHIAATSPVCVSRNDVPEELVAKEKEIAMAQAEGKPPQAIEKIVQGKLDKYFSNSCFLEQSFVKDPDHSIQGLLTSTGKEIGAELTVEKFVRFQVGEEV